MRDIRQRPGRTLLTLLSVVIAVAGLVAVSFATQSTRRAFDDIYQTMAGRAALEVSAPIGDTFDETILDTISRVPGVKAAAPLIQRRTILYIGKRGTQVTAMGIDPKLDPAVHDYEIDAGKSLVEANGVMLNTEFANNLGVKLTIGSSAHAHRQYEDKCRRALQSARRGRRRPWHGDAHAAACRAERCSGLPNDSIRFKSCLTKGRKKRRLKRQ